jgi:hypothetical protein
MGQNKECLGQNKECVGQEKNSWANIKNSWANKCICRPKLKNESIYMNAISDQTYFDFLYPNRESMFKIPSHDKLFVVYKLPISTHLYDTWMRKNNASWSFDRNNPNTAIELGSVFLDRKTWMTWGPFPMIWMNRFDSSKNGRNIQGIAKEEKFVEVNHKMSDISEGTWFTINPGSGMFFDVGNFDRILVTRNKLSALLALVPNGAQELVDKYGDSFSWNGWGNSTTYGKEKNYISKQFNVHTLLDLINIAADNSDPEKLGLEWIANCPIIDNWIFDVAKKQGYAMIQYYNAAYNGFWSNEFVWIGSLTVNELISTRIATTFSPCTNYSNIVLSCRFNAEYPRRSDPLVVLIILVLATVLIALLYLWKNKLQRHTIFA